MRLVLSLFLTGLPLLATAQTDAARLGTIMLPTSATAAAHADFITGVLYLHSFEYDDAAEAFRAAQAKEPGFAMAYWGEAMTHTHPLWNEQDLDAARAILNRLAPTREARAAKAPTARERAWLEAVEVLYGEGSKPRRDTLHARAMERVLVQHPDDEARTFLALAYLGLNQAVRDVPSYMKAGALALEVLQRNPDHPGAAHYAIHAFDDPAHAPLGLHAAKLYSGIAPGAAHAQHMTTHIFLALGMWPEVIAQNIVAAGPNRSRWMPGHYTYWLHYGLLQAGRIDEAAKLLDELRAHAGTSPARHAVVHLAMARGQQIVTGERWSDDVLEWQLGTEGLMPLIASIDDFAQGYAALRRGDTSAAASRARAMSDRARGESGATIPALLARQLDAAISRARGDTARAERELREVADAAAALPVEFGPPDFIKPPYEMLGEWLLEDRRPAEARQAFERALALMPGRLLSERGLRQANEALAVAAK